MQKYWRLRGRETPLVDGNPFCRKTPAYFFSYFTVPNSFFQSSYSGTLCMETFYIRFLYNQVKLINFT